MCQATQTFPLAPKSREDLADILEVYVLGFMLLHHKPWT